MKRISSLMFLFLIITITACDFNKGYEVVIDSYSRTLHVTMPPPRLGVSRIGSVDWKVDLDIIEKDIFDKLSKSANQGIFTINLGLEVKDQYGNTQIEELGKVGVINADEVKKYTDYKYFKGRVSKLLSNGYFNSLNTFSIDSFR